MKRNNCLRTCHEFLQEYSKYLSVFSLNSVPSGVLLWPLGVLQGRIVQVHVCLMSDKQSTLTKSHPTPVAISIPTLNTCTLSWIPWTSFSAPVEGAKVHCISDLALLLHCNGMLGVCSGVWAVTVSYTEWSAAFIDATFVPANLANWLMTLLDCCLSAGWQSLKEAKYGSASWLRAETILS